ncbi:MAG: phage holin family protein [bacterium]
MVFLANLIVNTLAVLITAFILPGVVVNSFLTALAVAIVLGVANMVLKPILILLTIPLYVLTLGFFSFIINALIILLVNKIVPGFEVKSIWWALLFSIILSLVTSFLFSISK